MQPQGFQTRATRSNSEYVPHHLPESEQSHLQGLTATSLGCADMEEDTGKEHKAGNRNVLATQSRFNTDTQNLRTTFLNK